jgi:hypothetical protein
MSLFCTMLSAGRDIRFVVAGHHPKIYGEFSGHSRDALSLWPVL